MRFLACICVMALPTHGPAAQVLVEAESFADVGGWTVDAQFMDQMGSPYLLAHGLGQPVAPAETEIAFEETGEYRVFVRTLDWVARWKTPGTPGRFALEVDGRETWTTTKSCSPPGKEPSSGQRTAGPGRGRQEGAGTGGAPPLGCRTLPLAQQGDLREVGIPRVVQRFVRGNSRQSQVLGRGR